MLDRHTMIALAALTVAVIAAILNLFALDPPILLKRAQSYGDWLGQAADWILFTALASSSVWNLFLIRRLAAVQSSADRSAPGEPAGVRIFHNRGDAEYNEAMTAALASARNVDVIGLANNRLTSEASVAFYREFLLQRNGRLRIMFLDPSGDAIRKREDAEYRDRGTLSYTVKHNLEDIQRFISTCTAEDPLVLTRIEVRLYDLDPHLNAILIDNTTALVHYYGAHSRGYDSPSYLITRPQSDLLAWYRQEWESLWALGYPMPGAA